MKLSSSLVSVFLVLILSACGKDSEPPSVSTAGQASVSTGTVTQTQTSTGAGDDKPSGPASPGGKGPVAPGTPDGAFCPVVELAGQYKVAEVACLTDGHADKTDASVVPAEYLVAAQGNSSGTVALKLDGKVITLTFPRNPDTWLDFQRNGTQCSDGATKALTQRCPGVGDSSCYYSLSARGDKVVGVYYRTSGHHVYECRSQLVRAQAQRP